VPRSPPLCHRRSAACPSGSSARRCRSSLRKPHLSATMAVQPYISLGNGPEEHHR
jgi:hypothetical protein